MNARTHAVATALVILLGSTNASAQFAVCPNTTWWGADEYIGTNLRMKPGVLGSDWPTADREAFDRAWSGWWYQDTSNYVIWADWTIVGTCTWYSDDGTNCLRRVGLSGPIGETWTYHPTGFSSRVKEADISVRNTTSDPLQHVGTCAGGLFSQEGTYVHELGHAYGYAHFNDWLATMNSAQPDVTPCQPDGSERWVQPSAAGMACHDEVYGMTAGYDVGGTPLRKTCALTGSSCASVYQYAETIPLARTLQTSYVEVTGLNQLDALPDYVLLSYFLSSDSVLDAGDAWITDRTWSAPAAFETMPINSYMQFNPQTAMPVANQWYCILVKFDSDSYFSETNEYNNVLDTKVCYRRI